MICIRNLCNAQLYIYTLFSITYANLYKNYTSAKFSLNKFAKICGGFTIFVRLNKTEYEI